MHILCFKQKVTFDSHENVISNKSGRLLLYIHILYHQPLITIRMSIVDNVRQITTLPQIFCLNLFILTDIIQIFSQRHLVVILHLKNI